MPRLRSPIRQPLREILRNPLELGGLALPVTADLLLWLDASDLSSLDASQDGDPVGSWADLSGRGNGAFQTTGLRKPRLKLNIQNGKPAVRFISDDYMELALRKGTGAATIFLVSALDLPPSGTYFFDAYGIFDVAGTFQTAHLLFSNTGSVGNFAFLNDHSSGVTTNAHQPSAPANDESAHVYAFGYNGGDNTVSANYSDTVDGTAGSISGDGSFGDLTLSLKKSAIGARLRSTPDSFADIDFFEFVVFDRLLTDDEIEAMEDFLGAKWGITIA